LPRLIEINEPTRKGAVSFRVDGFSPCGASSAGL
jgi:hypothetical protein